jgi:hypothetical protein
LAVGLAAFDLGCGGGAGDSAAAPDGSAGGASCVDGDYRSDGFNFGCLDAYCVSWNGLDPGPCALRRYGRWGGGEAPDFCTCDTLGCGFGACVVNAVGEHECLCPDPYVGPRCEACIDGWYEQEGRCIDACTFAGAECFRGQCVGTLDAPACECDVGSTGSQCELCRPGFVEIPAEWTSEPGYPPDHPMSLQCVADCGPCGPYEFCDFTRSLPSCTCLPGYVGGPPDCAWDSHLISLPLSSAECGAWQCYAFEAADETDLVCGGQGGALHLGAVDRSEIVVAAAEVAFPTQATLPEPAIRITYTGTAGDTLAVLPGADPSTDFRGCSDGRTRMVEGTGAVATADVCCFPDVAGSLAHLTLAVCPSSSDNPLPVEFVVHQLEFVSSANCIE